MSPKGRKPLPFESLPDPNENGVGVGVGGVVMGCTPLRSMPEVGYGSLDVSDVEACSDTDDEYEYDDDEYEYEYDAHEPEGLSEALTPAMARRTSGNSTLAVDIEACRQLIYVCIILLTMAIIIFGVLVGATNPVLDAEAIIG
mmetsp:Transcript_21308/g.59299  ORF Transcript_21308/g.59299 Transcript_21308/m.59299 type:complete len:143 (+) Transcript_21308:825-1253(+)